MQGLFCSNRPFARAVIFRRKIVQAYSACNRLTTTVTSGFFPISSIDT